MFVGIVSPIVPPTDKWRWTSGCHIDEDEKTNIQKSKNIKLNLCWYSLKSFCYSLCFVKRIWDISDEDYLPAAIYRDAKSNTVNSA